MTAATLTPRQPVRMQPWDGNSRQPRRWQADALPTLLGRFRLSTPTTKIRPLIYAVMGAGKSVLLAELAWLALHGRKAEEDVVVIAAPRQNLVQQLGATVRERCGRESVGLYYADCKQPQRPVIVCCYQSLPGLTEVLQDLGRRVALFIGDEAHRTECDTVLSAWQVLQPIAAVGFTATPYRGDETETLSLWTEVAYRYDLATALADGVLVPIRHLRLLSEWADDVGEEGEAALDRACLRLIREGERQGLMQYPMISSAYDIADAEHFAAVLRDNDIPSCVVHSQQTGEQNAQAISDLRAGRAKVLVQVTMLAEGSDFPWLRGLLQRRDMGSAVMAFQFLGRGLRSDDGKSYCVVLDPHRNLDRHGAGAREEALGAAVEAAAQAEAARAAQGTGAPPDLREIRLSFVSAVEAWTSDTLAVMRQHGLAAAARHSDAPDWREAGATERQHAALQRVRWACKLLPASHRDAMRALVDRSADLPRGAVSDLLSILYGVAHASKETRDQAKEHTEGGGSWATAPRWRWPDGVELPACPDAPKVPKTSKRTQEATHAP